MAVPTITLFIDDNFIADGTSNYTNVTVTSSGLTWNNRASSTIEYTYGGSGIFLGFSWTRGATSPQYVPGDTIQLVNDTSNSLYTVASSGSSTLATITYKDTSTELELEESVTLATEGKYLLHDIVIQFDGGTGGN